MQPGDSFDISADELSNNVNDNIVILPYDPIEPRATDYKTQVTNAAANNKFVSNLEREASSGGADKNKPQVANVMIQGDDAERSGSPNVDKIKDISLNSREVRLVGPEQKEVEMKDDLPTKVVVALENLQKEATEVLGSFNEKLNKTWSELKKSPLWSQAKEKIDNGWSDVKNSEVVNQASEKLENGWSDVKNSEVVNQTGEKLKQGWFDLKKIVEEVVSSANKSLSQA